MCIWEKEKMGSHGMLARRALLTETPVMVQVLFNYLKKIGSLFFIFWNFCYLFRGMDMLVCLSLILDIELLWCCESWLSLVKLNFVKFMISIFRYKSWSEVWKIVFHLLRFVYFSQCFNFRKDVEYVSVYREVWKLCSLCLF